ncbi:Protein CBG13446 [Caenorhabditis briggsae]|uniref:Protein CBG13446 n=1 Tax=Caenorhabditis briggsae TaxID=6238 RepID=A8XHR2_CAEBR|nr:Protein CBG13446 [Caenorhabditis briggsae]CAP32179.2 Protein CBG13446 [Caenorhabditis briggsae]
MTKITKQTKQPIFSPRKRSEKGGGVVSVSTERGESKEKKRSSAHFRRRRRRKTYAPNCSIEST